MGIFESFKISVKQLRSKIEEFKDDHKMASAAISEIIDNAPFPFNSFGRIIWNGIEKEDDAAEKMLDMMERIEKNDEQKFNEITDSIKKLIENNASHSDIIDVANKIKESKEEIVSILQTKLNALDKKMNENLAVGRESLAVAYDIKHMMEDYFKNVKITTSLDQEKSFSLQKRAEFDELHKRLESVISEKEDLRKRVDVDIGFNLKYANAFFYSGNYKMAIEIFDRVHDQDPDNVDALYSKGLLLRSIGKNLEAIECFNKAILINPNDVRFRYQKVGPLISLGETEKAIECYEEAIKINPNTDWNGKGVALMRLGGLERSKEAIKCFEKAIETDHADNYAWRNKGEAFRILGETEKAIECYEEAIAINSYDFRSWYYKGSILFNSDNLEGAIACWDEALKIKPDYGSALESKSLSLTEKGIALSKIKKYSQAITWFNEALKIKADDVGALINKGLALGSLGNYQDAIACFTNVLNVEPNNADALHYKNIALHELNK